VIQSRAGGIPAGLFVFGRRNSNLARMRRFLNTLYRVSGALAATFLVAIAVVVLLQVGANIIDWAVKLVTSQAIGLVVPSYAELTGFFLAASSFLALAYTLRAGGHIRVSLLLHHITGAKSRAFEVWCCVIGTALAGYFAVYTIDLVYESFEYNDLSSGILPVPLWIPQAGMALGLVVLMIALLDELVAVLRGRAPSYKAGDAMQPGAATSTPKDELFAE